MTVKWTDPRPTAASVPAACLCGAVDANHHAEDCPYHETSHAPGAVMEWALAQRLLRQRQAEPNARLHYPKRAYSGAANYATWNVSLWITSMEPLYRRMRQHRARLAREWQPDTARAFVDQVYPNGTPDLSENWKEIANTVDWTRIAADFEELGA